MIEREEQLEQHAKDAGADRIRNRVIKAEQEGHGVDTPAGVALLKRSVEPVADAVRAAIEDAKSGKAGRRQTAALILDRLEPEVSAYLAMREVISASIEGLALTTAAQHIGSHIEEELRLAAFEGTEPNLYHFVLRRLKQRGASADHSRRVFVYTANKEGIELPRLTKSEKTHVGVKLIDLVIKATGFILVAHVRNGKKLRAIIRPTEHIHEWLKDFNEKSELLRPIFEPMVVAPKDWDGIVGGGYMTSALKPLPLVKRASKAHIELLKQSDLSLTYRSLNAIQQTGWKINGKVLDVMNDAWERDIQLALPNREDLDLPPKPYDFDVNEEARRAWKMEARRVHEENATSRGRRLSMAQMMASARALQSDPTIYFPHQLDFRGRAYAVPVRLNPQGSDTARALLTFAEGKPITTPRAAGWMAIHGANLFGFDKSNLEERIAWTQDRTELIERTAADPFADMWWIEADKPWSFLAWVFDYAEFMKEGYGYVSSHPLSVDGSCNGLQHFSAMLRDPVGGAAVNLVPSPVPSDIYQRVADRVIERLKTMEGDWQSEAWLRFGIDRKITKRPVMVLPYGGTFRSCMDYVREAVNKKISDGEINPFGSEIGKSTAALAKLVWASISDVVVAARNAMDWLQQVARVASAHGVPLHWTTPSGFTAYQSYKNIEERRVKTRLQGSLVYLSQREYGNLLNPRRQALGIPPNFVHSLDASAMMLTIERARERGVTQFAMIHDSYGTVAADMDTLSVSLRDAFVDMYRTHNVLEEFLAGLPEEVRKDCPPIPPMGSLDLEGVRESDFFFA